MSILDLHLSTFDDSLKNFRQTLRSIEMVSHHTNIQSWMKKIWAVADFGVAVVAVVIFFAAVMTAETRHIAKWIANFEMKVISHFCSSYSL